MPHVPISILTRILTPFGWALGPHPTPPCPAVQGQTRRHSHLNLIAGPDWPEQAAVGHLCVPSGQRSPITARETHGAGRGLGGPRCRRPLRAESQHRATAAHQSFAPPTPSPLPVGVCASRKAGK
jgi:hypothetical protein